MQTEDTLMICTNSPVTSQNAGLFISRGKGAHPTRILDSYELILIKSGRLEIQEEEKTFSLEAGQTLLLFPARRHGGIGTLPPGLQFYWIHFELNEQLSDDNKLDPLELPQVTNLQRPEKLESLFRYFLDSQEAGDLSQVAANLLVMVMLVEIANSSQHETDESDKVSSLAEMVHNYIWIHNDRPITAGSIAEELGYNPDYLGRVYRKIYDCTITQAIHQSRVARACTLLIDSDMTIEEIARTCGFSDADYFRRIFRRYRYITPIAFRRINARVYVNTH